MKIENLGIEIKDHLNKNLNGVVSEVIVYGSQVKGTANAESDYDILIILSCEDSRNIRKRINDLCYDFDLKYNIFCDTKVISENELKHGIRGTHPFYKSVLKEGIHI
jgi:uncharacterized protein